MPRREGWYSFEVGGGEKCALRNYLLTVAPQDDGTYKAQCVCFSKKIVVLRQNYPTLEGAQQAAEDAARSDEEKEE